MKLREVEMSQLSLPRDAMVSAEQLFGLTDSLNALGNLTGDDVVAVIKRGIANQHLLRKSKDGKTREEREEARAERKALAAKIYEWLRDHSGPSYDGSRENAYNAAELLEKIGIERNKRSLAIVREVLESESTGWGKVDQIENQKLYAKKAALLVFRKAA